MGRMGGMKNKSSSSRRGASQSKGFGGFNFGGFSSQFQNGNSNFSNFNFSWYFLITFTLDI